MSFPNNTVANSFVAGAYLTIYFNARLKPSSMANEQPDPFKVLLVMFPLMVALGLSSVPFNRNVKKSYELRSGVDRRRSAALEKIDMSLDSLVGATLQLPESGAGESLGDGTEDPEAEESTKARGLDRLDGQRSAYIKST